MGGTAGRVCAGPARLCQALAVDRGYSGHDLCLAGELWLAPPADDRASLAEKVVVGRRIGVAYAGDGWAERPWRFWLHGNRSVSRP